MEETNKRVNPRGKKNALRRKRKKAERIEKGILKPNARI